MAMPCEARARETERLMNEASSLFGKTPAGWPRVQAICDFVQPHVHFGYQHARATRTAAELAISTTFSPNTLKRFVVRTDEVVDELTQLELIDRKVA
jgi:hypothetical protein